MRRTALFLLICSQVLYFTITVFGQREPSYPQVEALNDSAQKQKRDPFIPLIDNEGRLRRDFRKPLIASGITPHINLMGISKVNNVFYALVDGKWVKDGDILGDLTIDKIESDKIILKFEEKKIEIKLYREKK